MAQDRPFNKLKPEDRERASQRAIATLEEQSLIDDGVPTDPQGRTALQQVLEDIEARRKLGMNAEARLNLESAPSTIQGRG